MLDKEAKNYKEKEILLHRHQTPVYRKQNHRPNPVIKHFPENDNPLWQQRTVPGNSKYSNTVRNGKKTFIVGTSMVKGIRMKHVNSQLRNSFTKLRSFPGATLKHLRYYIIPSLIDEIPVRIILHGGCNDVNNKSSTPEKIANEIADMAILCRDYGVNNNVLKNLRSKNSNKVIIGHININSLRNKFELLTEMVRDKVDLLMISETKLDSSFTDAQFYMKSY